MALKISFDNDILLLFLSTSFAIFHSFRQKYYNNIKLIKAKKGGRLNWQLNPKLTQQAANDEIQTKQ